jgi:multidrug transporter EmrE-like cation transporter
MSKIGILMLYVALSLYGLYKMKISDFGVNLDFIVGFSAYAGGFLVWLVILKLYPLSVAFPLAAGALICGTQVVGIVALGEKLIAKNMLGILLILIGLFFLAASDMEQS